MGDYAEDLFEAIQILIEANKNKIAFDTTVNCEIISADEAAQGRYKVTSNNGLSWFYAYSENISYKAGDKVRVTVPRGDWSNPKYIDGKLLNENGEIFVYTPPLDQLVYGGDNLFDSEHNSLDLTVNGKDEETDNVSIPEKKLKPYQIPNVYDSIGIEASFYTAIFSEKLFSGSYGLKIVVTYNYPDSYANTDCLVYTLDSSKMYGNPFQYLIPTSQQLLISIPKGTVIETITLKLYQDGQFSPASSPGNLDLLRGKNIVCSNIKVFIGNNITNYQDKTIDFYPIDGKTEYTENDNIEKEVRTIWVNKTNTNKYLGYSDGICRLRSLDNGESWINYNPELYGEKDKVYTEEAYLSWSGLKKIEIELYENGVKYNDEHYSLKDEEVLLPLAALKYVESPLKKVEMAWQAAKNLLKNHEELRDKFKELYQCFITLNSTEISLIEIYNEMITYYYQYLANKNNGDIIESIKGNYNTLKICIENVLEKMDNKYKGIADSGGISEFVDLRKQIEIQLNQKINMWDLLDPYFRKEGKMPDPNTYPINQTNKLINKYNNHYSIYLFKKITGYDGSEHWVDTSGWKALNEDVLIKFDIDQNTIEKDNIDNNLAITYLKPQPKNKTFNINLPAKENASETYKIVLFYNHERYESDSLTFKYIESTTGEK